MFAPITPYAASKVVNLRLEREGISKVITPQMMYSYAKKSVIATVYGVDDKVYFDGNEFKIWLDAYVNKLKNGGGRNNDYDKLAEQYM